MGYMDEWKSSSEAKGGEPQEVAQRLLSHETQHGIAVTGKLLKFSNHDCYVNIHSLVICGTCPLHFQDFWCQFVSE